MRNTAIIAGWNRVFAGVALAIMLAGCGAGKFTAIHRGNRLTIDCQHLGEYASTVRRLVLVEVASGKRVWEVASGPGGAQVNRIEIPLGELDCGLHAMQGTLSCQYPPTGPVTIRSGVRYRLTVWGDRMFGRSALEYEFLAGVSR